MTGFPDGLNGVWKDGVPSGETGYDAGEIGKMPWAWFQLAVINRYEHDNRAVAAVTHSTSYQNGILDTADPGPAIGAWKCFFTIAHKNMDPGDIDNSNYIYTAKYDTLVVEWKIELA